MTFEQGPCLMRRNVPLDCRMYWIQTRSDHSSNWISTPSLVLTSVRPALPLPTPRQTPPCEEEMTESKKPQFTHRDNWAFMVINTRPSTAFNTCPSSASSVSALHVQLRLDSYQQTGHPAIAAITRLPKTGY